MICRLAIAVALISLIFASSASAQPETRITGVVRDATGLGIAGATVTATNRTTRDTRTATTGRMAVTPLPFRQAPACRRGVSRFSNRTQTVDVTPGEPKQVDFTLETMLSEEITVTATQARADAARRAVLGRGRARRDASQAWRRRPRERRGERRRLDRAEPRPRPEPGRGARRFGRPDRARSARSEGTGRRLPRRVGRLALALHAGPRSVRHQSRRGAARSARDAVRLRFTVGNRSLHHQPA